MNHPKTVLLLLICALSSCYNVYSQNDSIKTKSIKPLRLGVKLGIPNILTANAEYITPLLNHRVALAIDYMSFSKTIDDAEIGYSNFEIGTNIYFNQKGKGFYGGISHFSFDSDVTYPDYEFENGTTANGTAEFKFSTVNLKLGAKVGRVVYFRFEIGYALGKIPEEIVVKNDSGPEVEYEEIPELPGISSSGMPVFNIGFGFALF